MDLIQKQFDVHGVSEGKRCFLGSLVVTLLGWCSNDNYPRPRKILVAALRPEGRGEVSAALRRTRLVGFHHHRRLSASSFGTSEGTVILEYEAYSEREFMAHIERKVLPEVQKRVQQELDNLERQFPWCDGPEPVSDDE